MDKILEMPASEAKQIKRRTPEEEEQAIDMALNNIGYSKIATHLKFGSRHAFNRYRDKFKDFKQTLDDAIVESCYYLEEQLLEIPLQHEGKTAQVLSYNIMKILEYRNPKRYGTKFQHEVQVSVDISGSLERAEKRVLEATYTNVLQIEQAKTKQLDTDED